MPASIDTDHPDRKVALNYIQVTYPVFGVIYSSIHDIRENTSKHSEFVKIGIGL
ncbi:MAG: hypothetical protein CFH37_00306 [Alphaproteobacteria bacterium MarineAlpha9_Bin7]|nr:MAG: hypothetical protein CFH37_00306 [Alphaproteobacteria bacterium MarineAlpha9_Bin7]